MSLRDRLIGEGRCLLRLVDRLEVGRDDDLIDRALARFGRIRRVIEERYGLRNYFV